MNWRGEDAPPLRIAAIMRDFQPFWLVAGGWAIDLFLGRQTRPHEDIEIAVLRKDQTAIQDHLDGWALQKACGEELSAWPRGELLELPVHAIHCFNEASEPCHLELLLNESDEGDWVYRRNSRIRRPLARCRMTSGAGVPFLCPEIVLLYKSKNPRAKDEQDFEATIGRLDAERKKWLGDAIAAHDAAHQWLRKL